MTTQPRPDGDSGAHAFERFFERWFTRIHAFAARRVGAAEAEIVCERVLRAALLAREDLAPEASLAPRLLGRTVAEIARVRAGLHVTPSDSTRAPHAGAEGAPCARSTSLVPPRRVSGS
jgi:hypothetical protein